MELHYCSFMLLGTALWSFWPVQQLDLLRVLLSPKGSQISPPGAKGLEDQLLYALEFICSIWESHFKVVLWREIPEINGRRTGR